MGSFVSYHSYIFFLAQHKLFSHSSLNCLCGNFLSSFSVIAVLIAFVEIFFSPDLRYPLKKTSITKMDLTGFSLAFMRFHESTNIPVTMKPNRQSMRYILIPMLSLNKRKFSRLYSIIHYRCRSFQICPVLNANSKHHKVSSLVKSHQNRHNSVKYEVIEQYLRLILDVSGSF